MSDPIQIPFFQSKEDAFDWMYNEVDDPCVDNERFAFVDDDAGMAEFDYQEERGCCGSFTHLVCIDGRDAYVGCNYGH